jgi:dolichol-phosphate mannosyltransferase
MKKNSLKNLVQDPEIYKYAIIGGLNAILVLLLTIIFTSGIGLFYLLSAIIAYEISIIVSFFMHDIWTFKKVKKLSQRKIRFIKYNTFCLIGLGVNSGVLVILTDNFEMHYVISEFFAILITFVFNYSFSKKISFKN